jgi:hypothetical protein
MQSFFSSAFNGFASLFATTPAPTLPAPRAASAATTGEIATPDTFSEGMAGIAPLAEGRVTQAASVPVQAGVKPSWIKIALAVLNVAITKPGQDRRRNAVERAIRGLGVGAVALGVLAAGTAPQPVAAQPVAAQTVAAQTGVCADRAKIVDRLQSKYGESRQGVGVAQGQRVMEIWASEASGSWTIVMTLPDGSSCLIAAGEDWEPLADPTPVAGRGA